jgi:hypothetical protein
MKLHVTVGIKLYQDRIIFLLTMFTYMCPQKIVTDMIECTGNQCAGVTADQVSVLLIFVRQSIVYKLTVLKNFQYFFCKFLLLILEFHVRVGIGVFR